MAQTHIKQVLDSRKVFPFSRIVATYFILHQLRATTMIANATGIAFLASPWGAALLTITCGFLACVLTVIISESIAKSISNTEQSALTLRQLDLFVLLHNSVTGLAIGLGLATVVAPWTAIAGGFSAIIVDNFLKNHPRLAEIATAIAQLFPLAPLSLTGFLARNIGVAAAMVPSSITAWITPIPTLLFTGTGASLSAAVVITAPNPDHRLAPTQSGLEQ